MVVVEEEEEEEEEEHNGMEVSSGSGAVFPPPPALAAAAAAATPPVKSEANANGGDGSATIGRGAPEVIEIDDSDEEREERGGQVKQEQAPLQQPKAEQGGGGGGGGGDNGLWLAVMDLVMELGDEDVLTKEERKDLRTRISRKEPLILDAYLQANECTNLFTKGQTFRKIALGT